ncbi:TioE family transcriptional regulator [Actinocrispum wychmicini]|uniref:DNA-binding transcriptional MerR regulator n=1 Tax=Actinocrispum wychmicini TaxID=1213861 RepID=A0A4R2JD51_9PSEU|nr:TioE family transcriptional regulator [Actinocrispum wychmicini]TCO54089.1 DNA-binding transcriptional MerR regulator [Actinocrispum wychmicini]
MQKLRPVDLAREHGITPQAVRNYEQQGLIPPAQRTATGYRVYTEVHAAALRAHLAIVPAHGYAVAREIMRGLNTGHLDVALTAIDRSHAQLLRDRETLEAVSEAVTHLTAAPDTPAQGRRVTFSIGRLADRLGVTAATLRNWEDAGIVVPQRMASGHRTYGADDVRDAELAHLLRRGGYRLEQISTVVQQIRTAGGTLALSAALTDWQQRLTARGVAMLNAANQLAGYVAVLDIAHDRQSATS